MSEKYDFVDKNVEFEEAVLVTKEILENEINKLEQSKKLVIKLR
jgi:translation elongation factor EF-Ts